MRLGRRCTRAPVTSTPERFREFLISSLARNIKSFAHEIGLDSVRITNYNAKSVIVVALSYNTSYTDIRETSTDSQGLIAAYTRANYYHEIKTKLKKVALFLKKEAGLNLLTKIYSNGPIPEKPLAEKAGIGWYGKHGLIVNRDYGSWIVLGEMITDLELPPDEPSADGCGNCRLCIDFCPTGAIVAPYILDVNKCISYISQHKVDISDDIMKVWQNRLYGCDSCQDVCPYNKSAIEVDRKPEYGFIGPAYSLTRIINMDEKEYRQIFHGNQMSARWIDFSAIKRNAIVANNHLTTMR